MTEQTPTPAPENDEPIAEPPGIPDAPNDEAVDETKED